MLRNNFTIESFTLFRNFLEDSAVFIATELMIDDEAIDLDCKDIDEVKKCFSKLYKMKYNISNVWKKYSEKYANELDFDIAYLYGRYGGY